MVPLRAEAILTRLRDLGIATPQQIDEARQELAETQDRFSLILTRRGWLRDPDAGKRLAAQLGAVPQRLDPVPPPVTVTQVPSALWRAHRLVPVAQEQGKLVLATDDPLSVFALEVFSRACSCPVEAVLVREPDMIRLLEQVAGDAPPSAAAPAAGLAPAPSARAPEPPGATAAGHAATARVAPGTAAPSGTAVDEEPIVRLIDSMLSEAGRRRASDIHLEPSLDALRVRYRIDGVLQEVNSPPRNLLGPMVSRIKIMGGLNIAEKRLPQDGRLQLSVDGRLLDVRISTLPSLHGESIVLRLLDRSQPIRGLPEMGLLSEDQAQWGELLRRPHGMILVTGPTGSGKTTTLYGALGLLNQPDRKLITVEDPVEYQLPGVNQVLVRAGIGLTFAAGLRAMLRQAPDVVMVGEIRDQETAQIAIQAALTGHLVLSTLHTNDAPSAVTRLIDMGIAPFLVASTIQGILAQRLVRRICPGCRLTENATPEERAFLGPPEVAQLIRGAGCEKCHGGGFLGRIGLYELLTVNERIRQLITAKASAADLRRAAVAAGMRGLVEDGRVKIREGLTTMAEVLRVVTDEAA